MVSRLAAKRVSRESRRASSASSRSERVSWGEEDADGSSARRRVFVRCLMRPLCTGCVGGQKEWVVNISQERETYLTIVVGARDATVMYWIVSLMMFVQMMYSCLDRR